MIRAYLGGGGGGEDTIDVLGTKIAPATEEREGLFPFDVLYELLGRPQLPDVDAFKKVTGLDPDTAEDKEYREAYDTLYSRWLSKSTEDFVLRPKKLSPIYGSVWITLSRIIMQRELEKGSVKGKLKKEFVMSYLEHQAIITAAFTRSVGKS